MRRRACAAFAVVYSLVVAPPATAQTTYTWQNFNVLGGNWSVGSNWVGGVAPTGTDSTDILAFTAAFGQSFNASNNISSPPFLLNRLTFAGNNGATGGSSGPQIAGNAIRLTGTNPVIESTSAGNMFVGMPVNLAADVLIIPNANSVSTSYFLSFGQTISGAGGITIDGTGTTNRTIVFFSPFSSNTYSGGTTILGGATLRIYHDARLGSAGITLAGGTLWTDGAGGTDTSTRTFTFTSTANTIQTDAIVTVSGLLTGSGGFTLDRVVGSGQLRISGNANDYSGGTTIQHGTLMALNSSGSATGSGSVTVNANGTLGGTGLIAGSVNAVGTIRPGVASTGAAAQGNLRLGNGLSLGGGGTYSWSLGGLSTSNPGTNFDAITLTGGNLALGGTSKLTLDFLTLEGSGTGPNSSNAFWTQQRFWTIVDVTGSATNSGDATFATITNANWTSGSFSLQSPGLNGGDIVLVFTPVPEPGSVLLCAAAAGLLAGGLRRWNATRRATAATARA